jgi:hypothetical protein
MRQQPVPGGPGKFYFFSFLTSHPVQVHAFRILVWGRLFKISSCNIWQRQNGYFDRLCQCVGQVKPRYFVFSGARIPSWMEQLLGQMVMFLSLDGLNPRYFAITFRSILSSFCLQGMMMIFFYSMMDIRVT